MKKLNLVLLCLACVAMLASCKNKVENPEPTIQIHQEEGFVEDNATININEFFKFGFDVASNTQTGKELKSLVVTYAGETETLDLTGMKEYAYTNEIKFTPARDNTTTETITATVTDVDNETATATITLIVNLAQPLTVTDFSWNRHGAAAVTGGIEEVGLAWTSNGKEDFAILKPVEGATLYGFAADEWNDVTTDIQKAALFTEGLHSVMSDFRGVSAWSSKDYDFVIGTIYKGKYNLIHITRGEVSTFKGTDVTISGQIK